MARPRKPPTAHLTKEQRREVGSLCRSLERARERDAHQHARMDRALVAALHAGVMRSAAAPYSRRLKELVASHARNEAKILGIFARLQALGLSLTEMASGMITVDGGDNRAEESRARDSAGLARRDRKAASDKRASALRAAYAKEVATLRVAAREHALTSAMPTRRSQPSSPYQLEQYGDRCGDSEFRRFLPVTKQGLRHRPAG